MLCLALCFSPAHAQSGAGSIQGTVVDSTGAVIRGAAIHVVKQATGVADDTKTNKVGFYQVLDLFTGTYTVTVTAPGMKTYERIIELLATQTAVGNPTMVAGAETQTVEVTADPVQLTNTEDGTIASTIDAARISQIPMNTRELLTLVYASTPGFNVPGSNTSDQRANGLFSEALNYVADGVTLTDRNFGGENNAQQGILPDPDSIQQVSIKLTDASAQYATPGTAVITTKSGTNKIHGTMFETAVNNFWGLAKTRNDVANEVAPHYVRNEFGVSLGGPIVIPHVYDGKDKSFWLFAFERYSLASSVPVQMYVPSVAMRNGDFSNFDNSVGDLILMFDPDTTEPNAACPVPIAAAMPEYSPNPVNNTACRTQFPNNMIPASRMSPFAKLVNDITPLPSNTNNPKRQINLDLPNPTYVLVPTITFRIDQNFNESNKLYLQLQLEQSVE